MFVGHPVRSDHEVVLISRGQPHFSQDRLGIENLLIALVENVIQSVQLARHSNIILLVHFVFLLRPYFQFWCSASINDLAV